MIVTKLADNVSLSGRIEEITISEFRKAPGDVLTQVELGKTFVIKRNGKDIAVLSKVPGVQLSISVDCLGQTEYDL